MDAHRWARIESLYHAALAKEPAERPHYLAAACAQEPELQHEVESLLGCIDIALVSPVATARAWSPGLHVGSYEILGQLGAGGMGVVYRALDTKLRREVAIKVLPPEFQSDPSRLARFEREARLVAALNHPRIAAIYGLEVFEEIRFLVLELVEGPTLAERLASGRIEIGEALRIGVEIAEGLEAAHDKGVIHRDLKPGNIKLTADGEVKILDFGLAKATGEPTLADANSPTMTAPLSVAGLILGTPAYMSPEQAQGKQLDRRTDIWSFGVVMYEMLTGEGPFTGESMADILGAVLRAEPDWSALPIGTPSGIRRLLRRCLERDCKQRLRDIGEARIAIEAPQETAQATAPSQSRLGIMATGAAALFFVTGALLALIHFSENRPVAELVRFQIPAPGNSDAYPIVSPNGRLISFEARDSAGRNMLWVRSLDSLDTRPLPGTENSAGFPGFPVWSPDSRFLAFEQQGKLKKVEVSGGAPQALCDYQGPLRGGAWSRQGVIVFGSGGHGLMQVSDSGGAASPVTAIDTSRQEIFHAINGNSFLPDGRHFVYYRGSRAVENRAVYVGSLDAKPEQQSSIPLAVTGTSGLYVPSPDPARGYFLFRREGALLAQPFDNRRLQLAGEAVLLSRDITNAGASPFSASETGVLTYITASPSALSQLTWLDRDGRKHATVGEPGQHYGIALSRDGTRAAVGRPDGSTGNGNIDVWIYEFASSTQERLTSDPARDALPVWSPDGSRIAFSSNRALGYDLYEKASNGVGNEDVLFKSNDAKRPYDWSPDGQFLLYGVGGALASGHYDLWYLPLAGDDSKPKPYLQTTLGQAQFSPDGRFVAYTSDETGKSEVYVRPFPRASDGKWVVSTNGGTQPRWRRDGRELFYISADSKMMAAGVTTSPEFKKAGDTKALFTAPVPGGQINIRSFINAFRYDVTPDGQTFLVDAVATGEAAIRPLPITVVLNWQTLLKK